MTGHTLAETLAGCSPEWRLVRLAEALRAEVEAAGASGLLSDPRLSARLLVAAEDVSVFIYAARRRAAADAALANAMELAEDLAAARGPQPVLRLPLRLRVIDGGMP